MVRGDEWRMRVRNPVERRASRATILRASVLKVLNEPGITLYCHCKGATQPKRHPSHLWCDAMAAACLDYPELVDCIFESGKISAGRSVSIRDGTSLALMGGTLREHGIGSKLPCSRTGGDGRAIGVLWL